MFKALNPSVFNNSLIEEEQEFGRKLKSYNFHTKLDLKLQNDATGKTVLTWYSRTDKTIACPVNEAFFLFSDIGVFDDLFVFNMHTYFNSDPEKMDIVAEERDEIKKFLKMLHRDAPVYYK